MDLFLPLAGPSQDPSLLVCFPPQRLGVCSRFLILLDSCRLPTESILRLWPFRSGAIYYSILYMITYLQLANLDIVLWVCSQQGWLTLLLWRQPLIVQPFFPSRCFPSGSCPKCSPSFLPISPGYWSQIPLSLRLVESMLECFGAWVVARLCPGPASLTCLLANQMPRTIVETVKTTLNYVIKSKSVFGSVLISKSLSNSVSRHRKCSQLSPHTCVSLSLCPFPHLSGELYLPTAPNLEASSNFSRGNISK